MRNTGPFIEQLHNTSTVQQVERFSLYTNHYILLFYVVAGMLQSRQIPANIALQLDERVSNAGFDVEQVIMTPMSINHKGKAGELLW